MSTSMIAKGLRSVRNIASGAGIGGKSTRIELNKDFLVSEHNVIISVSQASTGVPTSSDVRRFISSIELQTATGGKKISVSGHQVFDLGRFTEVGTVPQIVLGATSTARYIFQLHHHMDGALRDAVSCLRSGDESSISLNINWAQDTDNGFIGGTVQQPAVYSVVVESCDYPSMTLPKGQWGNSILGSVRHYTESQNGRNGTASGKIDDILLTCGNKTRFVTIHAFNTTIAGIGTLSDAILDTIRIDMGNGVVRDTTAYSMQQENIADRTGLAIPGFVVIDFGDDEAGWLDLRNVAECRLKLAALPGTPPYRIEVAQDYIR